MCHTQPSVSPVLVGTKRCQIDAGPTAREIAFRVVRYYSHRSRLDRTYRCRAEARCDIACQCTNAVVTTTKTVTVTATPGSPWRETSAQNVIINSSVVQNAPNSTERFENLLPLVPGVVRGPDGRLNLKGASSTQAGWLVNSSNVTDPATGDKAMNLPIDVVSSVKVLSKSSTTLSMDSSQARSPVLKRARATSTSFIYLSRT